LPLPIKWRRVTGSLKVTDLGWRLRYRTGEKALLSYNVYKAPELSNPMDPSSAPTSNTCFVLSEIYESKAGVLDHFKQGNENWEDVQAFVKWLEKCKITLVPAASIFNSLW
jgi:quinol monooxygenase YgiN